MSTRLIKKDMYEISDLTGLAKNCDWFISNEQKINISKTDNPKVIFMTSYKGHAVLKYFINSVLTTISSPFVLIFASEDSTFPNGTGERRWNHYASMKEEIETLIDNEMLLHIFVENLDTVHEKMTPIPLGLLYHDNILLDLSQYANVDFSTRDNFCFFSHRLRIGPQWQDRTNTSEYCKNEWKFVDYYEVLPKREFIEKLKNSKFCICVHGGGYDPCPRFFEAILYGAIPIIEHSPLDPVFSKFPVVFVDKWSVDAISEEMLSEKLKELRSYYEDKDKRMAVLRLLTIDYWWDIISNFK
jgi:hypothetical protein